MRENVKIFCIKLWEHVQYTCRNFKNWSSTGILTFVHKIKWSKILKYSYYVTHVLIKINRNQPATICISFSHLMTVI